MEGVLIAILACAGVCTVAVVAILIVARQADAHRRDAESWALRFMTRSPEEYLAARDALKEQDRPAAPEPEEPEELDPETVESRRQVILDDLEAMDRAIQNTSA